MITGTITASDYLNAQHLHGRKRELYFFVLFGAAIIIGLVLPFTGMRYYGNLVIAFALAVALGELLDSLIILPWKVRRLHSQQKDFASPFTYSWDSEFLEEKSVRGAAKRPWKNFAKIKENKNLFLLYHADNQFEMVPKKWFENKEQESEFRELAKNAGT